MGRLADGWLGSLLTPAEAGAAAKEIQDAAAGAGREVEEDHFGLSLPVTFAGMSTASRTRCWPRSAAAVPRPTRRRWSPAAGTMPAGCSASTSRPALSKFVVRPASPGPFGPFLDGFVRELLPVQN